MSALSWEALISMIDPLVDEGYTVTISKGADEPDLDFIIYDVKVMDGDKVVATGRGGYLTDALAEAYESTPERGKE